MILVIGGTRGTGLLIARLLHQRGRAVRVLARDPIAARSRLDQAIEVIPGDITVPATLPAAFHQVEDVIFTAGCRSGRFATEPKIKATEYGGVVNVIEAALTAGMSGRLLYMTASGATRESLFSRVLNLYKGNTLRWRSKAEAAIRSSGLDYTIIRAGVLFNRPVGVRPILVTQRALPLSIRYRISRGDVAEAFVAAHGSQRLSGATIEVVWGSKGKRLPWDRIFADVRPDSDVSLSRL